MTFAFLPNYFKKIGIACFIAAAGITLAVITTTAIEAIESFSQEAGHIGSFRYGYEVGRDFAEKSSWVIRLSSILLMLSMAMYMLAKEKVDDEYMDAIRWESLRLSVIISLIVTIACILLSWKIQAKAILFIQFITYLITFKVKKSRTK